MENIIFWLQLPILLLSIVLHECAHGLIAYKRGDDTAYHMGRLTLNPLMHVDPVGTILVPLVCYFSSIPMIGWAKPVPVNYGRLDSPKSDMGKVAAAGPLINFAIAFAVLIVARIYVLFGSSEAIAQVLFFAAFLNIFLAVFNLLPLPPLDGGRIVTSLLPINASLKYSRIEPYGMFILLPFIFLGGARIIIYPVAALVYTLFAKILFF